MVDKVDALERDAVKALLRWLDQHPVLAEDGDPLIWTDGKPVALDVLQVIATLRQHEATT